MAQKAKVVAGKAPEIVIEKGRGFGAPRYEVRELYAEDNRIVIVTGPEYDD